MWYRLYIYIYIYTRYIGATSSTSSAKPSIYPDFQDINHLGQVSWTLPTLNDCIFQEYQAPKTLHVLRRQKKRCGKVKGELWGEAKKIISKRAGVILRPRNLHLNISGVDLFWHWNLTGNDGGYFWDTSKSSCDSDGLAFIVGVETWRFPTRLFVHLYLGEDQFHSLITCFFV